MSARPRLKACVENWPECETGEYNPSCCRFPKSCSATVYDDDRVAPDDLEETPEVWVDLPDGPPFVGLDWEVVAVPCEDCKFRFNLLHDLGEWADQLEADGGPGVFLAAEVRRRFLDGRS